MKIVTDGGVDLCLSPQQAAELDIHTAPLLVSLMGKTYRGGLDISNEDFYALLGSTSGFPATSQPSPGVFAEISSNLAKTDRDILSIHMSSGLSGTLNAAKLAAGLVPEANITYVDTKTLSVASGWQAVAAARALKRGWPKERVLALVKTISDATETLFTLNELRYLIHGGRISHIKGLMANLLKIKPIITVEKERGTYVQQGQAHSLPQAIETIIKLMKSKPATGSALRVQVAHALNYEGAAMLHKLVDSCFRCTWLPDCTISLVLGAHTGPSIVGMAFAPAAAFGDIA